MLYVISSHRVAVLIFVLIIAVTMIFIKRQQKNRAMNTQKLQLHAYITRLLGFEKMLRREFKDARDENSLLINQWLGETNFDITEAENLERKLQNNEVSLDELSNYNLDKSAHWSRKRIEISERLEKPALAQDDPGFYNPILARLKDKSSD